MELKIENKIEQRAIIFSHKRALGDGVMFTAGIRDFKLLFPQIKINVDTNQPELFENNPYIDSSIKKDTPGVEYYRVGYPMVGNVNNTAMHFSTMFLFDMIASADLHKPLPMSLGEFCSIFSNGTVGDPPLGDIDKHKDIAKEPFIGLRNKYQNICEKFIRQKGDVHLSEKEKSYNLIQEVYGFDKYWVIAPGGKRDATTKIWDWRRFQEVIDYFEGRIKFVVIGKSDLLIEKLNNVIDLTDKFNKDIRGLISLIYHADGAVSGPSALLHLTAAMPPRWNKEKKPCVAIFGGREPTSWSWYCNYQILHTNGVWDCCDDGGCWKSRVTPLPKDPEHNKSLCEHIVKVNDRLVPACMNTISAEDVIRAIEKYYNGNIYSYLKKQKAVKPKKEAAIIEIRSRKKSNIINVLGNLNSSGGGEQSLCKITKLLSEKYDVRLYPWGSVHDNYKNLGLNIMPHNFKNGMLDSMDKNAFLFFYANDCIWDFVDTAQKLVENSSEVIIGINYCNGTLPKATWLDKTGKLKAIVFQNEEKKNEFERDALGFENTEKKVLFGAIELEKFLNVCINKRQDKEPLVILKSCVADYRKYVTINSVHSGEKIHLWQKNLDKELDTKFYTRLLKDTQNTRFEFMQAHEEVENAFKNEPRMVFHKWDAMPVTEFLSKGHIFLYRTSNMWRDNYPRVVAEALAAGLPIISEPRDGTKDRIIHGETGFYAIDYDSFLNAIKLLQRKEDYRHKMGMYAKDWARQNLDPRKWVEIIEEIWSRN